MNVTIIEKSEDKRQVSGWAYVSTVNGKQTTDHRGDQISIELIEKAAHSYLQNSREGKAQHAGPPVAYVVNSIVFTKDLQKALGIDLEKEGWFITLQITDSDVWAKVKSGNYSMFSIAGRGWSK